MNLLEENHDDELSLFTTPPTNTGIQAREWIEYRPTNQVSGESPLEFLISPQPVRYMDLRRSVLRIKLRLLDAAGNPIAKDNKVALVNLGLHSIFSQVDCYLQQTSIGKLGSIYPYKAYMDTLLNTGSNDYVQRTSQFFYKDTAGHHDDANVQLGGNQGLYFRSRYTDEGRSLEMEGPIHLDIFQQKRLIINGVSLALKFWPSKNAFRLMSGDDGANYSVQILESSFKLCMQKPNSGVLLAHDKLLGNATALYPFVSTSFKTSSISKGEYSHSENNMFQGEVPSQLVVALVSSEAFNGSYKRSPFNFQAYDCDFLALYIDGQTFPAKPLQPNFSGKNYVEAYRGLTAFRSDVDISYFEYSGGYTLFVLNIDDNRDFNTKRRGDCRLELRFGSALPESITVLMYAKFPTILHVDQSRSVLLQ